MPHSNVIDLDSSHEALEAILPVVKIALDGHMSLIGTAFVVSATGIVITAKHVILDNIDSNGDDICGIGVLPIYGQFAGIYRSFRHSSWHSQADIALCECARFVDRETRQEIHNSMALTLSLDAQPCDEPVSSQFFHDAELQPDLAINVEKLNPLRQWRSTFKGKIDSGGPETPKPDDVVRVLHSSARITHGRLTNYFAKGRDTVMLPFPVFETNMPIYAGASGGPVFNSKGQVIAVNCTRVEGSDVAYHTDVVTALDLFIPNTVTSSDQEPKIRTLCDLAHLGAVSIYGINAK